MQKLAIKAFISFVVLCFSIALFALYNSRWSPAAQLGHRNQQNIKHIKKGMSTAQVAAILGNPVHKNPILDFPQKQSYSYQIPPGSTGACVVEFDAVGNVVEVYCSIK